MPIGEEHIKQLVHLYALWIQILGHNGLSYLCAISKYF